MPLETACSTTTSYSVSSRSNSNLAQSNASKILVDIRILVISDASFPVQYVDGENNFCIVNSFIYKGQLCVLKPSNQNNCLFYVALHCRQNNPSHLVVFASTRCPAQSASATSTEMLEAAWRNNSLLLTSSACTVCTMVQNNFSEHGSTWYVSKESTSCGLSSSWNICTNNISHNCRLRLVKYSFPPCSYHLMSIYPESSNSGKFC